MLTALLAIVGKHCEALPTCLLRCSPGLTRGTQRSLCAHPPCRGSCGQHLCARQCGAEDLTVALMYFSTMRWPRCVKPCQLDLRRGSSALAFCREEAAHLSSMSRGPPFLASDVRTRLPWQGNSALAFPGHGAVVGVFTFVSEVMKPATWFPHVVRELRACISLARELCTRLLCRGSSAFAFRGDGAVGGVFTFVGEVMKPATWRALPRFCRKMITK